MVMPATLFNGTARHAPPPARRATGHAMPDFGDLWVPDTTLLPNGWGVAIAVIGPELAAVMLRTNREDNRNKRPTAFGRYADDMRCDRWELTHQGIAFDRKGRLCDGQHRLTACVSAGRPFETLVFFGVGEDREMAALDTGATRSAADASAYVVGHRLNHKMLATYRSFLVGGGGGSKLTFSHPHILSELVRNPSFAAFHTRAFSAGNSDVPSAPVRAAVMRAYYHHDPNDLIRFAGLLMERTDPSEPRDRNAKLLRRFLQSFAGGLSGSAVNEVYRKAQRAVFAYLAAEQIDKLFASDDDLFPLPTPGQIADRNSLEVTYAAATTR